MPKNLAKGVLAQRLLTQLAALSYLKFAIHSLEMTRDVIGSKKMRNCFLVEFFKLLVWTHRASFILKNR